MLVVTARDDAQEQAFRALFDRTAQYAQLRQSIAEAAGVEMPIRGLQALHADDDALLAVAMPLFDALRAAAQACDDH